MQKSREKGEDVFEACWQSILFSSSLGLEADTSVKCFLCRSVRNLMVGIKVPIQRRFWVGRSLPHAEMAVKWLLCFQKPSAASMAARKLILRQLHCTSLSFLMPVHASAGRAWPPSVGITATVTLSQYYQFWGALGADWEVPFLDLQLCLGSSGECLVSRKSFMGEEKHDNYGEVHSSASMKMLADQMLVLNLGLSW